MTPGKVFALVRGVLAQLGIISSSGTFSGVSGPASSTDNAVALFDGTTGKTLKNSTITRPEAGALLFPTAVVLGSADTSGVRLDLESGALAVREGDDSGYGAAKVSGLVSEDGAEGAPALVGSTAGSGVFFGGASNFVALTANNTERLRIANSGTTPVLVRSGIGLGATAGSTDTSLVRLGAGQVAIGGSNGVAANVKSVVTTSSALSGASVTLTGARPAGSIVLGVTVRVTTAITGATSFDVGDGSDADRYGASVAVTLGTTTTLASHTATPLEWRGTAGDIVLTANGGNFSAGVVRVCVHYLDLTAPTN